MTKSTVEQIQRIRDRVGRVQDDTADDEVYELADCLDDLAKIVQTQFEKPAAEPAPRIPAAGRFT